MAVAELDEEIANMSSFEPRLSPENPKLRDVAPLKKKTKNGPFKLEEAQQGNEMDVQEIKKPIKVEEGLFPFNRVLHDFLYALIKTFG